MKITHGSLFSGIGGFDLAALWNGWENVFQCEIDTFCLQVLEKNYPNTIRYTDIFKFNAKDYYGTIDVISGGFPCQPFSVAGNRKGKNDDRYLWAEMLRIINDVQPSYVVAENVPGIISMELDTVLSDLENIGYKTETFIIPACSKGAWHRRERVWITAYSNLISDIGNSGTIQSSEGKKWLQKRKQIQQSYIAGSLRTTSNANSIGIDKSKPEHTSELFNQNGKNGKITANSNHTDSKKQWIDKSNKKELFTPRCSSWWSSEPGMDRVVNGLPNRVHRLKSLGNAIVPQIADEFFKSINIVLNDRYSNLFSNINSK